MRFRNRFKADGPAELRRCEACGARISVTIGGGRETRIHEFPLCDNFRAWMRVAARLPGGEIHDLAAVMVDDAETLGNAEVIEIEHEGEA